ncbi:MAG: hypothetical protein ACTSWN_03230 [Promethearchaeota archaeon]
MVKVILEPILRRQAIVRQARGSTNLVKGQTYIAISTKYPKTYSFLIELLDIKEERVAEPVMVVDRRLIGPLAENDVVELYPYNLPTAEKVIIGISDQYRIITPGNWTNTFLPVLKGRIMDGGNAVNCAIQISRIVGDDKPKPMVIQGLCVNSVPKYPVRVGQTTVIEIKKYSNNELQAVKREIEEEKKERAKVMEETLKQDFSDILGKIKTREFAKATANIKFSEIASVPQLDNAIHMLFSGLECFEEKVIPASGTYNSTRSYIVRDGYKPTEVIEYHLTSTEDKGMIIIHVFSENPTKARRLVFDYEHEILQLQEGLSEKPAVQEHECPLCGGELELEKMKIKDGTVKCSWCGSMIKLSRQYRF